MRNTPTQPSAATADLRPLTDSSLLAWKTIQRSLQGEDCIIDGSSLDIASVVAVAKLVSHRCSFQDHVRLTMISRYGIATKISTDDDITKRINDSVRMLRTHLDKGHVVYGRSNQCMDSYH
jgi:phenylalanine ammonia-lyase